MFAVDPIEVLPKPGARGSYSHYSLLTTHRCPFTTSRRALQYYD